MHDVLQDKYSELKYEYIVRTLFNFVLKILTSGADQCQQSDVLGMNNCIALADCPSHAESNQVEGLPVEINCFYKLKRNCQLSSDSTAIN